MRSQASHTPSTAAGDSRSAGSPSYQGTGTPALLGFFGGGFNNIGGFYLVQDYAYTDRSLPASDAPLSAASSDTGQPARHTDSSSESSASYADTGAPVLLGYLGGGFNNIGGFYLVQDYDYTLPASANDPDINKSANAGDPRWMDSPSYQDAGDPVLLGYFGGSFDNFTGAYLVSPYF